jgi:aquaporin Z
VLPATELSLINQGVPALGQGVTPVQGIVIELVLTFFLVLVIFGTAVDKRAPKAGGLFIGLTVTLDILMGGPLTGGCMNPARYLGPALAGGGLSQIAVYLTGTIAGAVLAALVYQNIFLEDKSSEPAA